MKRKKVENLESDFELDDDIDKKASKKKTRKKVEESKSDFKLNDDIDKKVNKKIDFRNIILIILTIIFIICSIMLIIKLVDKYRCPKGYQLYNKKCGKIITYEPLITKYCNKGYQLENDVCKKTTIIKPQLNYYCQNTYKVDGTMTISASTLNGEKCTYTMSHEPIKQKKCLYGAEPYSDTKCRIAIPIKAASRIDPFTGRIMYYCPGDEELIGTTCYLYGYSDYSYESICATGFYLNNNGMCVTTHSYDAAWEAKCLEGFTFVDKNTCIKNEVMPAQDHYKCYRGYYFEDKLCKKIIYYKKK